MPDQALQSRVVRRRNPRPINSCVECRTRKSRCSKTHPCQNCTAFGRECVFITVPESASRKKQRESSSKPNTDWTQPLPLRTQSTQPENANTVGTTTTPGTPPRDYEWEAYQQHVEVDDDIWEKLPAEPEETHDDVYEDEDEDEDRIATDLTIRIGRMIISENITGFFRPQYAEELGKLLSEHPTTSSSVAGQRVPQSSSLLSAENLPSLSPSLNLLLGASSVSQSKGLETLQLPTRLEAEALYQRYLESVSPLAHVLHTPSFKRIFDRFWMNIELGNSNQSSSTALVLSVCMAAAATFSPLQAKAQFGITREGLFQRLQSATECALLRANWSKTSNIRTLQALTIYLIPLCRAQISRATSVVVGALVRLAQCIGIHRVTHNSSHTLTPLQRHVRSLLWYQICFLDFKTAEAQGPHPSIRSDDFDIPLPLNVDDDVFEFGTPKWQHHPISTQGFTDVTLSLIRYECNEMHRLIFRGRIEMDRKSITLHDLRARVEARKRQIHAKYLRFLDAQVPIQRYAGLVATLLMARCDSMLLYRHLPQTPSTLQPRSESESRLRDVLLTAGLTTLEIGATLETLPNLHAWQWYSSTYQQYHAVLLLLTELYRTPDLPRRERMMTIIDHIFGHCYGVGVRERCGDLLWTVKENLEGYYVMKGVDRRKGVGQQLLQQQQSQQQMQQQVQQQQHYQQQQHRQRQHSMFQQQNMGNPNQTPDLTSPAQMAFNNNNPLNLDLDTLLQTLGNPSASNESQSFEDFFSKNDSGSIFIPVDPTSVENQNQNDWMDGVGMPSTVSVNVEMSRNDPGANGQGNRTGNGMGQPQQQQWVRSALENFFRLPM
ncbi:hypothetical protein GQ43DRAFT_433517 [Delitschia confertaspora ATCC 74209]|uniref:Zn(2)-C6 fungal-type domain-containing protein n=1 Tax=Delitschia confertaspora ATCC 74209 TaxID=1513339 RepID=A0A9P4JH34_9PLEO|nr:hypothetical protein GQ43DRAFT_433517 [Delitschia confertaspora ATCC 74209]